MKVTTRAFNIEEDYGMLYIWWRAHNSFPPKRQHLPKDGLVVEVDGKEVCAGFMYQTDSAICIFEFMVCNPKADKEHRELALTTLIKEADFWARKNEYEMIYTSTGIKKFVSRLEENGFLNIDNNQCHCFKEIK